MMIRVFFFVTQDCRAGTTKYLFIDTYLYLFIDTYLYLFIDTYL